MLDSISLVEIIIYPIKSLAGVYLDESTVVAEGLKYDRMMMLVDDNGLFITQRKYPQLALLKVEMLDSMIKVIMPDKNSILIEKSSFNHRKEAVRIWKDNCIGFVAENSVNRWFSQFLEISVRLIKYDIQSPRASDPEYSQQDDIVSFADGFPLLAISQASLNNLNSKLDSPVSMQNFRPNLVLKNGAAFNEDTWKQIKVGNVIFDAVKLCSRCVMTTINPNNGVRDSKGEPYKTLSTYREIEGKVCFGMNLIARGAGLVKIGDPLEIIK